MFENVYKKVKEVWKRMKKNEKLMEKSVDFHSSWKLMDKLTEDSSVRGGKI